MSLSRGRNIFSLGNFQLSSKRRQPNDPFEKDPFKIQSYNFRYAERPSFPVPALQQQRFNKNREVDCQTYFYNNNFPVANNSFAQRNTNLQNDERVLNLNEFQAHRRRKYLQETATKRNTNQKSYDSKILNLYYGKRNVPTSLGEASCRQTAKSNYAQNNKQNLFIPRNSSQSLDKNFTVKLPSSGQLLASTTQGVSAGQRRKLSSGCEININIQSLEDNSLQDNVNIKIETDSLSRNLNIPMTNYSNGKVKRLNSCDTFVIDKRLSKFSCNPVKQCDIKMSAKERVKELTSIYSSQMLKKFDSRRLAKSTDRLPTFVPLRTNSSRVKNSSSFSKENQCYSYNTNLFHSPYVNGETKILNTFSLAAKSKLNSTRAPSLLKSSIQSLSSATNRCDFKPTAPLRLRSSRKLPLNVNINVFADKLKLLKV